jgi:hypothetical protein
MNRRANERIRANEQLLANEHFLANEQLDHTQIISERAKQSKWAAGDWFLPAAQCGDLYVTVDHPLKSPAQWALVLLEISKWAKNSMGGG